MRSKNRLLPVTLVTIVCLAVAVFGYALPKDHQQMPVKIKFDNNGGMVLFSHLVHHRDYNVACSDCHHDRRAMSSPSPQFDSIKESGDALPCGSCHPVEFGEDYASGHREFFKDPTSCVRCHHIEYSHLLFNHEEHEEYGDCRDCHHDEDIEPEPEACSNCHTEDEDDALPSMRAAGHERCADCHDDMFELGLSSCKSCHHAEDMENFKGDYTNCGTCHEAQVRELVLPRMNAFHDQCMDCHERAGAGPSGPDNCKKCHIR